MPPDILVFAGFRCHVLLGHDVVGSLIDNAPTWKAMTVNPDGVYFRGGQPVFIVSREPVTDGVRVTVKAFRDTWLQEPGLSVKVARVDNRTWRGFGPHGKWTSDPYALRSKREVQPQAYRSTVHFARGKKHPLYTVGVEYKHPSVRWRFRSDGGFTKLLDTPAGTVPWARCEVFGEGYPLKGVCPDTSERSVRRWELAAWPTFDWFHALGWTGGAGAVVNEKGRTAPPGMDVTAADGYDRLWAPEDWRVLRRGQSISQTLTMRTLSV